MLIIHIEINLSVVKYCLSNMVKNAVQQRAFVVNTSLVVEKVNGTQ